MGEELFKIEDIYDEHKIASRYRTRHSFLERCNNMKWNKRFVVYSA